MKQSVAVSKGGKGISGYGAVQIIRTFSEQEFQRFREFAASPYFNKSTKLTLLITELMKYFPDFSKESITAGKLFFSVSGSRAYNDALLRKYMSELKDLAEQFLNTEEALSDRNKRNTNILNRLVNRSSSLPLMRFYAGIRSENKRIEQKGYEDYLYDHLQEQIILRNHVDNVRLDDALKSRADSFESLMIYFLFNCAFVKNESHSYSLMRSGYAGNKSFDLLHEHFNMGELVVKFIEQGHGKDKNDLQFLKLILNDTMLAPGMDSEESFRSLLDFVMGKKKYRNLAVRHYVIYRLISHLYSCKLSGIGISEKTLFELWKELTKLNSRIHSGNEKYSINNFRGILLSAITNNQFTWARKFLRNCATKVRDEVRKNILNYGNAVMTFYSGDYRSSLDFISSVHNASWVITFDIYMLKAQIFYELGYFDSVLSVLDTFRHFLRSGKSFSDDFVRMPAAFMKALRTLVSLNNKFDSTRASELLQNLEKDTVVSKRVWLIDKLKILLSQNR